MKTRDLRSLKQWLAKPVAAQTTARDVGKVPGPHPTIRHGIAQTGLLCRLGSRCGRLASEASGAGAPI